MSTKSSRKLQIRRRYGKVFKQSRVDDFEKGIFTVAQICRMYEIGETTMYRWIERYTRYPKEKNAVIVEVANSQTEKVKQLEQRIAKLEGALGRKQIQLDYYECLLEELKEEGVDVEKKRHITVPLPACSTNTKGQ
jgi:transposase-like protein